MRYVLKPAPLRAHGLRAEELEAAIVLVGCGGTGGFLAESVCRLLLGRRAAVFLVDPDRVESVNVSRQAFELADVGRFKAEVLAERLVRRFGMEVGYSVLPYDARVHDAAFARSTRLALVVGAVDNAPARRAIAATLVRHSGYTAAGDRASPILWLDAGNGRHSGQVLLGNALRPEQLKQVFDPDAGLCHALPAPSLQRPDLLTAPPEPTRDLPLDCARAVSEGEQSRTINQVMAALVATYLDRLLDGTCSWMATYVDLTDGVLRCMPAEPRSVATSVGLRPQQLVMRTQQMRAAS